MRGKSILARARAAPIKLIESVEDLEKEIQSKSKDPLILDADGLGAPELARALKQILAAEKRLKLLLLYDPFKQSPRVVKLIEGLAQVPNVWAFKRPFNLLALSSAITTLKEPLKRRG